MEGAVQTFARSGAHCPCEMYDDATDPALMQTPDPREERYASGVRALSWRIPAQPRRSDAAR